jgi:hypothetical protein
MPAVNDDGVLMCGCTLLRGMTAIGLGYWTRCALTHFPDAGAAI